MLKFGQVASLKLPSEMSRGRGSQKVATKQTVIAAPAEFRPSIMDDLIALRTETNEELDYGFVVATSAKVRVKFTEDMIPNQDELDEDMEREDRFCLICDEPGMDSQDLRMHLMDHNLWIDSTLEDWIAAKEAWEAVYGSEDEPEYESNVYGNADSIPDRE